MRRYKRDVLGKDKLLLQGALVVGGLLPEVGVPRQLHSVYLVVRLSQHVFNTSVTAILLQGVKQCVDVQ